MDAYKRESQTTGTPTKGNDSLFSSDRRVRYASLCCQGKQQPSRETKAADENGAGHELFTFSSARRCVTFSRSSVAAFFRDE